MLTVDPQLLEALDRVLAGESADATETETLDFKQASGDRGSTLRSLLEASICFANAHGGHVVLGVKDRPGGSSAFTGRGSIDAEEVRLHILKNTEPALITDTQTLEYGGAELLVVSVPSSVDVHADRKGRATRRVGTDCLPMSPDDHARLREARSGADWSARLADAALVPDALATARRRLSASAKPERRALANLTDDDLARALGAVDDDSNLNNAGAIALGTVGVRYTYTYRDTPGGEPVSVQKYAGPLLVAYDQLIELIAIRQRLVPVTLPNGQQIQIEDFPSLAVREALTNAFIHREYFGVFPVVVEHSPQILTISSPGLLVAGVTAANIITHPSKPRNPQLAHITSLLELSEEVGRGVDRMYREMVRAGRTVPQIDEVDDYTRVSLVGGAPDLNIARYVAQLPSEIRDDTDALLTILFLTSKRSVTAAVMAPILQKSEVEATASLDHLASDHVEVLEAVRTGPRAKPTYRLRAEALRTLGTAVTYARQSNTEIEKRIVAHVREYDRITNQTVRNLLTVSMSRANTIIRDLRNRGILEKIGDAQRGPTVAYGPGPKFPPKKTRRPPRSIEPDRDEPLPGL